MSPSDELDLVGLVRDRAAEGRAKARVTRARNLATRTLATELPVARVLLLVAQPHLDRLYDYAVTEELSVLAQPGVRVKVPFAGRDVDGFVVERRAASDFAGTLQRLRRVVSGERVLTPEVFALVDRLAEYYAGTRSDLLRLAVPGRHAATEEQAAEAPVPLNPRIDLSTLREMWAGYDTGAAFLGRLASGESPRALWHVAPGSDWAAMLASFVAASAHAGRGALVVLPDATAVDVLHAALVDVVDEGSVAVLRADAGPARRYASFLRVLRGEQRIVVGTRAAAFAPVQDLGLVVVWDDGDENHAEQHAPYPNVREVLVARAELEGTAAVVAGFTTTTQTALLQERGWVHPILPLRETLRRGARISVTGAWEGALDRDPLTFASRLPHEAHRCITDALLTGPVLVQVPRRGYAVSLACETCRLPAHCPDCGGPLATSVAGQPPACRWCGHVADPWTCPVCGAHELRAPVVGDTRTAEELGRTFPGARVVQSHGGHRVTRVGSRPGIVVATPGAEPLADGGYAAVVLLDTWLASGDDSVRRDEETLRRWSNALGLLGPQGRGLIVGEPSNPLIQSLVGWTQPVFAGRELASRREAHLPPAWAMATITGEIGAVDDAVHLLGPVPGVEVLGPVATDRGRERAIVRVEAKGRSLLTQELGDLQRLRSARALDPVRVQVDPVVIVG